MPAEVHPRALHVVYCSRVHCCSRARQGGRRIMLSCPECDAVLEVAEAELEEGDSLSCEECGASLVVVATDPAIELEVENEGDLEDEEEFDEELDEEDAELDGEKEDSEEDDEDWH